MTQVVKCANFHCPQCGKEATHMGIRARCIVVSPITKINKASGNITCGAPELRDSIYDQNVETGTLSCGEHEWQLIKSQRDL
jgi:hypothetical protein